MEFRHIELISTSDRILFYVVVFKDIALVFSLGMRNIYLTGIDSRKF